MSYKISDYRTGNTAYKKLIGYSRLFSAIKEINKLGFIDFEMGNIEKNINLNTFTQDDTIEFDIPTFNILEEEIDKY